MNKLVSVIVPVYNTEKYIKRCIDSILGQTYTNLELILINDGSTENEEEIILDYAARDSRVRYMINEGNIGQYLTRLKGVGLAKGEYIAFVDSDDYINVDFIRLLVNKAVEDEADMVFSTTVIEKISGEKVINIYHDIELKKLPLEKEALAEAFYATEGKVYVWYTIWNKLYKKDLWLRAIPYLERLDKNIRMIEDMACVAILVCLDAKAVVAENSVYYYCQREDSATSRNSIDIDYYKYCVNSIFTVFQFIKEFLSANGTAYLGKFDKFVAYYGRIWRRSILLLNESEYEEAEKEVVKLCMDIGSVSEHISNNEDTYFNGTQTEYDDSFDKIKEKIIKSTVSYISFDVFDTAVLRPFIVPSDIFYLLDKIYEENADSTVSFHDIRIDAEISCRQSLCTSLAEDISLEDIYNYLFNVYGVPKSLCSMLKKEEEILELKFAQRRRAVYEIYELALLTGKKVIFTSDMYLDKEIIKKILLKCGYNNFNNIYISSEFGKRKDTGNLYKVLMDELGISCDDFIHIGDNKSADIKAAEKCGIQAIYIPRTVDVFKQKVNNAEKKCSGYGCMIAMVANKYFDNPYRYFHPMTTYNMDPYLMGYYALGMNLVAQLQWIESNRDGRGRIVFTSRDGYLMHRAYDIYNKYTFTKGAAIYKYTSRRAMLPVMLSSKADFMKFPMQVNRLTPNEMCNILSFCSGEINKNELSERYNIQWDKIYSDRAEYHRFMDIYYEHIYSIQAHRESIELVKEYLADIENEDAIYDMGYTATMHYAVAKAINKTPKALYIHTDMDVHQSMSRKGDFCIDTLMPDIPSVSSILREYIYSSTEGSCVGYERVGSKLNYMLENVEHIYSDAWPLHVMQEAALSFVEEFCEKFALYKRFLVIRRSDIIEPLEDLLQVKTRMDTKVFNSSYFDDVDVGKLKRLNVRDYWLQILLTLPGGEKDIFGDIKEFLEEKNKKGLAYWGTGKICEDILRAHNIKVDVFYDNNPAKAGMRWHNGVINNPTNDSELKKYYIVIACAAYAEVEMQLQKLGLDKYKDYVSYIDIF